MVQPSAPSRASIVAPRRPLPMNALSPHPVGSRSQTRSWRARKVGQSTRAAGHTRVSETAVTQRRGLIESLQRIERACRPTYGLLQVAVQLQLRRGNGKEVVGRLPVD